MCVRNEARKLSFASNVSHFQRPLWSSIGNRGSRPGPAGHVVGKSSSNADIVV